MIEKIAATADTRTHFVEETLSVVPGTRVTLAGWVQRRRDLGSVVFLDLRDRTGILQLVCDVSRGTAEEAMKAADAARNEYVVVVTGTVVTREEKSVNPKLETGQIELLVTELTLVNRAKNPPFYIEDDIDVDEQVRLKYRYLDLRRPEMQRMMRLRHEVFQAFRNFLHGEDFLEVETPILTRSTPEGARDYIVPSRLQQGAFYALPQSPQIFKQLLMVAGYERYYQIARCFRDEDLRADRQPEFTQLDIETSFLSMDALLSLMERMFASVFSTVLGVSLELPFQRLTYEEAMDRYGSDKPDLRFDLPLVSLNEVVAKSSLPAFQTALAEGGAVKALVLPGCAHYSRKQLDDLAKYAMSYGLKGLATLQLGADGMKSSLGKWMSEDELKRMAEVSNAHLGDLVLIGAGPKKVVRQAMGALRLHAASLLGLVDSTAFRFLWIVDFPLFSLDEETKQYVAEHHPFTMPRLEDLELLETNPGAVRAQAYDLVLNGFELSSGSMRIYRRDIQERMFAALGFTPEEAKAQFGFLLDAFEYGTPPHGGIAFGLDRLVMLMGGGKSLRDCVAFPKTASATDLMMDAPAAVAKSQLDFLGIQVAERSKS
ncbi:MAG: aspartate--tRNA ligase [Alicyclobacillaceae bacterium]|nr:aspartate--tRNA ligase [Alicyclobacillaceae bacterium]